MECDAIFAKSNKYGEAEGTTKLTQTFKAQLKELYDNKEGELKSKNEKLSDEYFIITTSRILFW